MAGFISTFLPCHARKKRCSGRASHTEVKFRDREGSPLPGLDYFGLLFIAFVVIALTSHSPPVPRRGAGDSSNGRPS
jgi:hypothetical protein